MHSKIVTSVVLATVLAAPVALADEAAPAASAAPTAKETEKNNRDMLGKGTLIISAERVFGFSSTGTKVGDAPETRQTQYGFLWSNPQSVYQTARMGIDYLLIDNVTVGGALGIAHSKTDLPSGDTDSTTNLLFAPRVGYLFGGTGVLSFWARVGPSFWRTAGSGDVSAWGFAVNVEPAIIISPYSHLGIYLGGAIDLGLAGKVSIGDRSENATMTNYGVNSGLAAWF